MTSTITCRVHYSVSGKKKRKKKRDKKGKL